jgi:MFS transporter, SP family, solute carrier family 2 (facilitated glucose transporter), member 1
LTSAVLGSAFQFGYNTGVINAPGQLIRDFINETHIERNDEALSDSSTKFILAIATSIFAIGGCIGGVSNVFFADRFGR